MKLFLKSLLPKPVSSQLRSVAERLKLKREFRMDARRYRAHAIGGIDIPRSITADQLEAMITKDYHRIEKGFSLASPKRPFGEDVLQRLDELIPLANRRDPAAAYLLAAVEARDALRNWNASRPGDNRMTLPGPDPQDHVSDAFFTSRRSVRDFSDQAVDLARVDDAVELALQSPSVCNRAPWRVRIAAGAEASRLLGFQNGSRGFAASVPVLALITARTGLFTGAGERNQAWIEGGIFGSTLLWALHAKGLATCMLNLSLTNDKANALREAAQLDDAELPIMMIAIGHARQGYHVARSPRRTRESVRIWV